MYCANGHQNSEAQRYCGECGAPLFREMPDHEGGLPRSPVARWPWIVAIVVAVVAVIATAVGLTVRRQADASRWSAMPHTMGCAFNTAEDKSDPQIAYASPPGAGRATQVGLAHGHGQQLVLSIPFAQRPELGRFLYLFAIRGTPGDKPVVTIISPTTGEETTEWIAGRMDYFTENLAKDAHGKPGPRHHDTNLLTSVEQNGNEFDFVVDLAGQSEVLGKGTFKPSITISALPQSPAESFTLFYSQECRWDTPASTDSADDSPALPVRPSPTHTPQLRPGSPPVPPAGGSRHPLPDASVHGFMAYPEAQCLDIDPAVALGRTADSLVVICQNSRGAMYYRGFGLGNHLPLLIDSARRTEDGFVAFNNGYQYTLSRDALVVTHGSTVVSNEPMVEYWSG
jgi:hypothetical protein